MFKSLLLLLLVVAVVSFVGCMEKNTEDPIRTYTYWAGQSPTKDVQPIHGKYWESAHWSKEYIMYMEVKASPLWMSEFIKQNNLIKPKTPEDIPSDAPSWFKPDKNSVIYTRRYGEGSLYYVNTKTQKVFIYEIQL